MLTPLSQSAAAVTTEIIEGLGFSISTETALLAADNVFTGQNEFTDRLELQDGLLTDLSLSFAGATNTGFYRTSANVIIIAIAGANTWSFGASATTYGPLSIDPTSGAPGFRSNTTAGHTYYGNQNTGSGSRNIYFQQAGENRFTLGSNGRAALGPGNQAPALSYVFHVNGATATSGYGGVAITGGATSPGDYINCRTSGGTVEFQVASGGNVTLGGLLALKAYTVGTLPSAAASAGSVAQVTDSSVAASGNYGATVSGGGANRVKVFSDGTNWIIA